MSEHDKNPEITTVRARQGVRKHMVPVLVISLVLVVGAFALMLAFVGGDRAQDVEASDERAVQASEQFDDREVSN